MQAHITKITRAEEMQSRFDASLGHLYKITFDAGSGSQFDFIMDLKVLESLASAVELVKPPRVLWPDSTKNYFSALE